MILAVARRGFTHQAVDFAIAQRFGIADCGIHAFAELRFATGNTGYAALSRRPVAGG